MSTDWSRNSRSCSDCIPLYMNVPATSSSAPKAKFFHHSSRLMQSSRVRSIDSSGGPPARDKVHHEREELTLGHPGRDVRQVLKGILRISRERRLAPGRACIGQECPHRIGG